MKENSKCWLCGKEIDPYEEKAHVWTISKTKGYINAKKRQVTFCTPCHDEAVAGLH